MKVSKLLKDMASTTDPVSSIPVVTDLKKLADTVYTKKIAANDAEAVFRTEEAKLLKEFQSLYAQYAASGDFTKSINFTGTSTPGVQVVTSDSFSSIPVEQEPTLTKVLGKNYSKFFEEKRTIVLKSTDDATIEKLVAALGPETFKSIFDVKVQIAAKDNMDRNQFSLPAEIQAFLKQKKPSVNLIKE